MFCTIWEANGPQLSRLLPIDTVNAVYSLGVLQKIRVLERMVGSAGLEPATSCL